MIDDGTAEKTIEAQLILEAQYGSRDFSLPLFLSLSLCLCYRSVDVGWKFYTYDEFYYEARSFCTRTREDEGKVIELCVGCSRRSQACVMAVFFQSRCDIRVGGALDIN